MTPGGHCFQCREFTGRYDTEHRRWACRACWPRPADLDRVLEAANRAMASSIDGEVRGDVRLPGETRQEWRRRLRTALEPAVQEAAAPGWRELQRELRAAKHSNDPWRHRGARGTWGGA